MSRPIARISSVGVAAAVLVALWLFERRPLHEPIAPALTTQPIAEMSPPHNDRPSADASRETPRSTEYFHRQIEKFLEQILAERDSERREQLLSYAVNAVALTDTEAALNRLKAAVETEASLDLSARLVRRWAEKESPKVAAWAAQLPPGRNRSDTLQQLGIAWAERDPTAAIRWSCLLTSDEEWRQTLSSIVFEVVRVAPTDALAAAWELPADSARDNLVLYAAAEWAVGAPAAATAWAKRVDDAVLRERALSVIAVATSERDPATAGNLALSAMTPGRLQNDAVSGIVQRWAQTNAAQAAAWIDRFPPGELRTTAIENLASSWPTKDKAQAEYWLSRLTSTAHRPAVFEAGLLRIKEGARRP